MNKLANFENRPTSASTELPSVTALIGAADTEAGKGVELLKKAGFAAVIVNAIHEVDPTRSPGCLLVDVGVSQDIATRLSAFLETRWAIVFGPRAANEDAELVFQFQVAGAGAVAAAIEVAETYPNLALRVRTAIGRRELERVRAEIRQRPIEPAPTRPMIRDSHVRNDASGRLDARIIAQLFGLPAAEVSKLIGVSKQALSATPDAERIQESLQPFARIAMLALLVGNSDFRKWLNTAQQDFDGRTPLQLIRTGNAQGVADFVEDIVEFRSPHD